MRLMIRPPPLAPRSHSQPETVHRLILRVLGRKVPPRRGLGHHLAAPAAIPCRRRRRRRCPRVGLALGLAIRREDREEFLAVVIRVREAAAVARAQNDRPARSRRQAEVPVPRGSEGPMKGSGQVHVVESQRQAVREYSGRQMKGSVSHGPVGQGGRVTVKVRSAGLAAARLAAVDTT